MASYYQTRQNIPLLGGHICSKCKSVILTEFVFYAIANSRWSQKKAQEGAQEAANKGLKALQEFPQKPFLVTQIVEERTYSLVNGFGIERLDHSCPYCGNRERWQNGSSFAPACRMDPVSGVYLVTDVPEESRMTVLSSADALKAWRVQVLAGQTLATKQHWDKHPEEAARIRGQIRELQNGIEALNTEKAHVREKSQYLHSLVESKEAEMKGFSLFSAERKAAKAELKELNKQYEAQSEADFQREKTIISTIAGMEKQIREIKIANPGVLGEMENVTPADAPYCQAIRAC